ncbi:MAG TPA: autotransporter domain-containing protein [Reyranella sp.]
MDSRHENVDFCHRATIGFAAVLLAAACYTPLTARAQDATWLAAPGSNNFNTGANWSGGTTPTGIASFGASTTTSLAFSDLVTILNGLVFNAGAPAYTLTTTGIQGIGLNTSGIVNNSANVVTLNLGGANGLVVGSGGLLGNVNVNVTGAGASFQISGSGSLGGGTITTSNLTQLQIGGTITGGTAQLVIGSGSRLDISPLATTGIAIGSIEGGGSISLGSKQLTLGGNDLSTTVSGVISDGGIIRGTGGSLVKTGLGTLTLTGANTYTGATTVAAGRLAVNGSITSDVTVATGGNLGGSGTITGNVVNNGIVSPGNSIGTLAISGSYTQAAGSFYQVEVNAAGASDRIDVTGVPGTATINGGTVNVIAAPGSYARSTTYTIVNATGGVTGTYAGVTSNFAFLKPALTYDAGDVFLTLTFGGFSIDAFTPNQRAVGGALDQANITATGDLASVLTVLGGLSTQQAPQALDQLGGEVYSSFATAAVQTSRLFMNEVGRQMVSARRGGGRLALAEACIACDDSTPSPWAVWAAALGSTGNVTGDVSNTHSVGYTIGGFASGVDYRVDDRLLVGLGLGYTNSTQYLSGLDGRGTTDDYQAAIYASFADGGFYLDGLAGYGYIDNQMRRTIAFAGFVPRTATGRTHADQFFGQAEAGYRLGIYQPAEASLTPFVRLQTSSGTQAAFSESGAGSIDLNVAGQTTTSLLSVAGVELGGAIDMGWREKLRLQMRLGWAHEYVDVSHPVTASFAGAPTAGFTVFGSVPNRDSAIVSLAADTAIGRATSVYLRYDGDISGADSSHALSLGLRMRW